MMACCLALACFLTMPPAFAAMTVAREPSRQQTTLVPVPVPVPVPSTTPMPSPQVETQVQVQTTANISITSEAPQSFGRNEYETFVRGAQPCVTTANCSHSCTNRLMNERGESWHDSLRSELHPLDIFDPCNLGCCLRTDSQYRECAGRCWYWARADRKASRQKQYDYFHRCASGCDLRCRWNYAAIPPPIDGKSYLSNSSSVALSEKCPQRHFSRVQDLFVHAPDLEKLEQQRLKAQLLAGRGRLRGAA